MTKALYRKYRPQRLSDVVGQKQATDLLAKSLEQNKIFHAYLFIGPRGTGKTSVARIFAHEVNGFKYEIEDDYVDIIEIDGASNRGIDNIRELREKAAIAPTSGKYKVYIIDEVHMLTNEAFNALLKTLEEPPEHVIFIMATTDAYKVPVTITSRAQTYTFNLADDEVMFDFLKNVAKKEKIAITDDALKLITRRGGGSFRDSLSLLDQISTLSTDKITEDLVASALGLPSDEKIKTLLDMYAEGNVVKITTQIKDLLSSSIKPETLAEEIINYIIANPTPELFPLLEKLPDVKAPFPEAKLLVALAGVLSETLFSGPTCPPSTSYSGRPGKSALRAAFSAPSGIYVSERPNRSLPSKKAFSATPAEHTQSTTFNTEDFINGIKSKNETIYLQLKKSELVVENNELHIYPGTKVAKAILTAENNKAILNRHANNLPIKIHDFNERPQNATKDQILDKISDIMGGEVKKDGGENPFS